MRTSKTVDGVKYDYYYAGDQLVRMTYGNNILDFYYNAHGTPILLNCNGNLFYYITNLQGDVIRLVDIYGNIAAMYQYDPYGNVIQALGSHSQINPLRYRGYYYDNDTGMYYLQSRYYDPKICRFINADAFVSTGQGPLGYNMFAYCRNNPVCRIDIAGATDTVSYSDDGEIFSSRDLEDSGGGGANYFDAQQNLLDGRFAGGYNYGGSNYNLLGSWISTGRSQPSNLNEQIAMKAARTDPASGMVIKETLGDTRLDGFYKYTRYYPTHNGGIEIHYVGNPNTNTFGDFKFK